MFTAIRTTAVSLALTGALVASPLVAKEEREGKVSFFMYVSAGWNSVPKEVIADYLAANPKVEIDIVEGTNSVTYPKMVTVRRTTPDNPLVHCGYFNADSINQGDIDDMWEPLNPVRITNMEYVLPGYLRPDNRGVGYMTMGIGILYNTDVIKEPPTSWSELWDPKNEGKVVVFDNDVRLMALTGRLTGGDEKNMDSAFETWADNAQNFRALVDSNDALKNLLVSGDAPLAVWFSSVANNWIKEGAPLAFVAPEEGAIAFPVYLAISQGVSEQERLICEDLVNELMSAERSSQTGVLTSSIPVLTNAKISDEQMNNPILNPSLAENAIHLDFSEIAKNAADWKDRWAREVKLKMR